MASDSKARVYAKSTPNGAVTVYLGKKDFVDYLNHIDPIDGVVTVDSKSLRGGSKVFAQVLAAFHYGREDMDVMGLQCRNDIFFSSVQVYPPAEQKPLTPLQELLIRKLGASAHPFFFALPPNMADSVQLLSPEGEGGKTCGVEYELKVFVADNKDDKPQSGNSVRLAIRKLTFATEPEAEQPQDIVVKNFLLSFGNIRLEATLDKEKYFHGEKIAVNVTIDNNSSKVIKKIKFTVVQYTSLYLYGDTTTSVELCETECTKGFPIEQNQKGVSKVFHITPSLADCRQKNGVAVDGSVAYQDTRLASTTVLTRESQKERMGIVVSYHVKVRLVMGFATKDLSLDLPFTLTHPEIHGASSKDQQLPAGTADVIIEEFTRRRVDGKNGGNAED